MTKFYSKTTGGFYDSAVYANNQLPSDAVVVADSTYQALFAAQASGQVITSDAHGNPIATAPVIAPLTIQQQITALESSITPRMIQEAIAGINIIISTNSSSPFYNMNASQAIASVRSKIAALRAQL